jgi:transposase
MQIAAVATARKLATIVWYVLTDQEDYTWARPSLVAMKERALELQAGAPAKRGQKGPAAAYSVRTLRDRERKVVENAERAYARFVGRWRPQGPRTKPPAASGR